MSRVIPFGLLAMAALAWFEEYLPGHEFVAKEFGREFVLRLILGFLCLWVFVQEAARRHMRAAYAELLEALRRFQSSIADATGSAAAGKGEKAQAVRILIGALEAEAEATRHTALVHLQRITGLDLGPDPAAWRDWAEKNSGSKEG